MVVCFDDKAVSDHWGLNGQHELLHDRHLAVHSVMNVSLDRITPTIVHLKVALEAGT